MLRNKHSYWYYDDHLYFHFNNIYSKRYNLFIENGGEDLKVINTASPSTQYNTPNYQNYSYYLGTSLNQRTFKYKVATEGLTQLEFKEMMLWLHEGARGFLTLDSNWYWGYDVILETVGDATMLYNSRGITTEFELTFKTYASPLARGYYEAEYILTPESGLDHSGEDSYHYDWNSDDALDGTPITDWADVRLTNLEQTAVNEFGIPEIVYIKYTPAQGSTTAKTLSEVAAEYKQIYQDKIPGYKDLFKEDSTALRAVLLNHDTTQWTNFLNAIKTYLIETKHIAVPTEVQINEEANTIYAMIVSVTPQLGDPPKQIVYFPEVCNEYSYFNVEAAISDKERLEAGQFTITEQVDFGTPIVWTDIRWNEAILINSIQYYGNHNCLMCNNTFPELLGSNVTYQSQENTLFLMQNNTPIQLGTPLEFQPNGSIEGSYTFIVPYSLMNLCNGGRVFIAYSDYDTDTNYNIWNINPWKLGVQTAEDGETNISGEAADNAYPIPYHCWIAFQQNVPVVDTVQATLANGKAQPDLMGNEFLESQVEAAAIWVCALPEVHPLHNTHIQLTVTQAALQSSSTRALPDSTDKYNGHFYIGHYHEIELDNTIDVASIRLVKYNNL